MNSKSASQAPAQRRNAPHRLDRLAERLLDAAERGLQVGRRQGRGGSCSVAPMLWGVLAIIVLKFALAALLLTLVWEPKPPATAGASAAGLHRPEAA